MYCAFKIRFLPEPFNRLNRLCSLLDKIQLNGEGHKRIEEEVESEDDLECLYGISEFLGSSLFRDGLTKMSEG